MTVIVPIFGWHLRENIGNGSSFSFFNFTFNVIEETEFRAWTRFPERYVVYFVLLFRWNSVLLNGVHH